MEDTGVLGILLMVFTGLCTYKGLTDRKFFDRHLFETDGILVHKEYSRLISSGFLHAGWIHFGFNMIALLSFSDEIENLLGQFRFLLLYFGCLVGGNLLALYMHRNHADYRAVGASGAISGVVMSFIIFYPDSKIGFVIIPFEITSWLFGLIFVLISVFGIKSQADNIGHEAHLGGAITGVLLTICFQPYIVLEKWWIIALILIPAGLFLYWMAVRPELLMIKDYWGQWNWRERGSGRMSREEEMNLLLDKIRRSGIKSLSKKERDRLKELRDELL